MTVAEKYQFFLEFPSAGTREAFPLNDVITWQWRRADNKRYHRRDLTTQLTFHNDYGANIADFDPWYIMERNKQRCEKVKLTINAKCDEAFEEHYKGSASVLDGNFDAGLCKVDVKFGADDPYACIHSNWEKERNVLDYSLPKTAQIFVGSIQISGKVFIQQPGSALDSLQMASFPDTLITVGLDGTTIDLDEGWTPYRVFFYWMSNNNPNQPDDGIWSMEMQYVREFVAATEEPPGYGWIAVDGGYARRVQTKIVVEDISYGAVRRDYEVVLPQGLGIDNGRLLNDVLLDFFSLHCAGYTLVSNFFGINPDGTQPDNEPYQRALEFLQELMIFAKGDIIRSQADENNTLLLLTLKKLLENLEVIFNVEYRIIDDKIYLEHYSYFEPDLFLDLTAEKWLPCIQDKWAWNYAKEQIPPREVYEWEEKTDEGLPNYDFDSRHILYSDQCIVEDATDIIHRADIVMTNIQALIEDGNPDNWNITSSSFVLVATQDGYITQYPGAISGDVLLNGPLAWSNILEHYHKYGRPFRRGTINGEVMEFLSTKKIRKQVPIEIPMCCSELKFFDPDRMIIKTQLGHGEVESATYNDPPGKLTLELIFE